MSHCPLGSILYRCDSSHTSHTTSKLTLRHTHILMIKQQPVCTIVHFRHNPIMMFVLNNNVLRRVRVRDKPSHLSMIGTHIPQIIGFQSIYTNLSERTRKKSRFRTVQKEFVSQSRDTGNIQDIIDINIVGSNITFQSDVSSD